MSEESKALVKIGNNVGCLAIVALLWIVVWACK